MILYILGFLLLLLGLGVLFYLYKTRDDGIPSSVFKKSTKTIEQANSEANDIIAKASEKAKDILFETEYIKDDLIKRSEENINRVAETTEDVLQAESKDFEKQYKALFDEIQNNYTRKAGSILENIETTADAELGDFREVLRKETVAAQGYISKRTIEEFEGARKDIAAYKAQKMQDIEKNINTLVMQVAKDVLGEALPLSEHEKLVTDALERAKREGLFS